VATIKDVARLAGVGLGTASRVVNGRGAVSAATMEKVQKAIDELKFRPSHLARSMISGNSLMIGVYIPVLKGTFYTPILQSIDNGLRASGVHMVVAFGNGNGDDRKQELEAIDFLFQRGCDGIIAMSNSLTAEDLTNFADRQSKIVLLNHFLSQIRDQCFTVDHAFGGALAARAFIDNGHKKIAVIAGPASFQDNAERIKGFFDVLKQHGIAKRKVILIESDFSPEGGWIAAEKLMKMNEPFTALFCANDEMAVGALSYFKKHGILVPEQISVISYDNTSNAEYSAPRLTSVDIPWGEITHNAVQSILNLCYGSLHSVKKEFPITLHYRDSLIPHSDNS
jgi:LacI family transcriptional regulator